MVLPPPGELSLARLVNYTEKADARDKVVKGLQNFLKFLVFRYKQQGATDTAKRYKVFASALSEYRSIMKFGKPLKAVRDIVEIGSPGDVADALEIVTNSFDILYKLFDNIEFLSKYKMLGYNPDRMESFSKAAQFWCYLTQLFLDVIEYGKHCAEQDKDKRAAKMAKWRLAFIKDSTDFVRVAPPYLQRFNPSLPSNDGFAALMGTISGLAGAYSVWVKTK